MGRRQVLIAQEEKCNQRVYVYYQKKKKANVECSWVANCAPPHKGFFDYQRSKTPVRLEIIKKRPLLTISLPKVTHPIPVVIVMRALGVRTDKQLMEMVCYDPDDVHLMDLIYPSIEDADSVMAKFLSEQKEATKYAMSLVRDQDKALALVGSKVRNNVQPLEAAGRSVMELMFQYLEGEETRKAYFLGYMINQVCLTSLGHRRTNDRDHYKEKRLDLAGQLLQHQFRKAMAHLQRDIQRQVQMHLGKDEELGPLKTFVKDSLVTKNLQAAFTLGNWNTNEGLQSSGVVGDLKRMNPMASVSHLRQVRLNLPAKSRPTEAARHP